MPELLEVAGADLSWKRTGFLPGAFALFWNDVELGTLAWEALFSSRALAAVGDRSWRIRRRGFRQLALEDPVSGEQVGTLHLRLFGTGRLELADGRHLDFRRSSLLPPAWTFQDAYGSPLVRVRGRIAPLLRGGFCRIEPAAATLPEAALLALLGVYVLLRRARRRSH